MKHSISSFANKIRNKYPGDYDDLTDEVLVSLWLKKYPEDKRKLDIYAVENSTFAVKENESDSNFWFYALAVMAVGVGVFFASNSNSSISISPSDVVENISNGIQDQVASTNAEVFNENNEYSECFSLSDITIYKGEASVRVEPNQELILQKFIKNIGETIVLTNFKVIINDTYSYTGTSEETLNYVGSNSPFDTSDSKSLVVDGDLLGNCSIYLNGHFADETGNRFNYNNTKILNIKFICDQFSLEKSY